MLIVSRSTQQSVIVGEFDGFERDLKVTVLEIGRGTVRLGFEVVSDEPISPSKTRKEDVASVRTRRKKNRISATFHETNRWDDDGGNLADKHVDRASLVHRYPGKRFAAHKSRTIK